MNKKKSENLEVKRENDPFEPRDNGDPFKPREADCSDVFEQRHKYGKSNSVVCDTDPIGFATPDNKSIEELLVNVSGGFVALWKKNTVLNWRFNENSMKLYFADSEAGKRGIRKLLQEALSAWGDSLPVQFKEDDNNWDFEIYMNSQNMCNANGACVFASAFFPDSGRHRLQIYPKMFSQIRAEQVETLIHETGHMFGLRHFFAQVSEKAAPSEKFGVHSKFSIMNYGSDSKLTAADKNDLKDLYSLAWSGKLDNINKTPIVFVTPYHNLGHG